MGICSVKQQKKQNNLVENQFKNQNQLEDDDYQIYIDWSLNLDEIIKQLISDKIFYQYSNQKSVENIFKPLKSTIDSQQLIQILLKINQLIQQQEEQVYLLDQKIIIKLIGNFISLLLQATIELSEEDILRIQDKSLILDCLTISLITYHVLKFHLQNENGLLFGEQSIIKQLNDQYLKLDRRIRTELLKTYGRTIKQKQKMNNNNPLLPFQFNTNHAIQLVKKQTLRDKQIDPGDYQQVLIVQQCIQDMIDELVQNFEDDQNFYDMFDIFSNNDIEIKMNELNSRQSFHQSLQQ